LGCHASSFTVAPAMDRLSRPRTTPVAIGVVPSRRVVNTGEDVAGNATHEMARMRSRPLDFTAIPPKDDFRKRFAAASPIPANPAYLNQSSVLDDSARTTLATFHLSLSGLRKRLRAENLRGDEAAGFTHPADAQSDDNN